jgi:hypothetical protein
MKKNDFVKTIKDKYPSYRQIDDDELYGKIITKYPQYKSQIDEEEGLLSKINKAIPSPIREMTPEEKKAMIAERRDIKEPGLQEMTIPMTLKAVGSPVAAITEPFLSGRKGKIPYPELPVPEIAKKAAGYVLPEKIEDIPNFLSYFTSPQMSMTYGTGRAMEKALTEKALLPQELAIEVAGRVVIPKAIEAGGVAIGKLLKGFVNKIVPDVRISAIEAPITPQEEKIVGEVVKNKSMLEELRSQGHITPDDSAKLEAWFASKPETRAKLPPKDQQKLLAFVETGKREMGDKPITGLLPNIIGRRPSTSPVYGMVAGIEPEQDEQGRIKGIKFDPTKAAIGMAVMGGLRTKAGQTAILSEVDQILAPKKIEAVPLGARISNLVKGFQQNLISGFSPLRHVENDIYKAAGIKPPTHNMARKFELVNGAAGKGEADILNFEDTVLKNTDANALNKYLFLRRTQSRLQADPEVKKVGNWTVEKAQQGLADLERQIGPENFKRVAEIANGPYQKAMDDSLRLQVESGRMSPKLYETIKASNDFYAPFKVLKYMDENALEGVGKRISGTKELTKAITGIHSEDFQVGNILLESQRQLFKSRVMAEKNIKMLELDNLARLDQTGQLLRIAGEGEKARPGYKIVTYLKNGEPMRLEVTNELASAINGLNAEQTNVIGRVLGAGAAPFRWGATGANLGFQFVNLFLADTPRTALISKYGINNLSDLFKFPMDWTEALYSSITGNFGKKNALYRAFLESGAANSTIQRTLTPGVFERQFFERQFAEKGILRKGYEASRGATLDNWAKFANALEETAKLTTLKRGMRFENIAKLAQTNPALARQKIAEIATEVRNFGGSPDFARHGDLTKHLNLLFMFMNARLQGITSDITRLAGKTGGREAAKAWTRLSLAVGLPTTAVTLLNLSPKYRADYEMIPQRDRDNYWHIPREKFYTDSQGRQIREYWRIPKRETMQLMGNLIEEGIKLAYDKDPKAAGKMAMSFLENISPINIDGSNATERLQSIGANINPILSGPFEYATGTNLGFHKDIVPMSLSKASPHEQYTEQTPELYKKTGELLGKTIIGEQSPMKLEQLAGRLTGGALSQFVLPKPLEGREWYSELPIAKRLIRGKGTYDPEEEILKKTLMEQADVSVEQGRIAKKIAKLMETDKNKAREEFAKILDRPDAEKIADKIIDDIQNKGVTYSDRLVKQLQVENGERARYIFNRLKTMRQNEKAAYIGRLIDENIVTDNVAGQLSILMESEK